MERLYSLQPGFHHNVLVYCRGVSDRSCAWHQATAMAWTQAVKVLDDIGNNAVVGPLTGAQLGEVLQALETIKHLKQGPDAHIWRMQYDAHINRLITCLLDMLHNRPAAPLPAELVVQIYQVLLEAGRVTEHTFNVNNVTGAGGKLCAAMPVSVADARAAQGGAQLNRELMCASMELMVFCWEKLSCDDGVDLAMPILRGYIGGMQVPQQAADWQACKGVLLGALDALVTGEQNTDPKQTRLGWQTGYMHAVSLPCCFSTTPWGTGPHYKAV